LQGISVPQFYGTTLFDRTCDLPTGIEPDVLGVLLEFIDGMTLEDILDTESCLLRHPYIGEAAVDCFDKITQCGVLHGNVRLANLMMTDSGRVILLDFAFSLFRLAHVTDWQWRQPVSDQQKIKAQLHKKGLRDQTACHIPMGPVIIGYTIASLRQRKRRGDYSIMNRGILKQTFGFMKIVLARCRSFGYRNGLLNGAPLWKGKCI